MKSNRFAGILVLAVILALLGAAVPATPALAASLTLNPYEGEISSYVYVSGSGFTASYYVSQTDYYDSYVDIYFSRDEAVVGYDIDDEVNIYKRVKPGVWVSYSGTFSNQRFTVPTVLTIGSEDVHGGSYYVSVTNTGSKRIRAVTTFTVIAGEITLDPDEGAVGTEVEITGEGFAGDEEITVEYAGDEVDIESGDEETDSGDFSCTIIIPESTKGKHTVTVTDESGSEAEADFTVEPALTLTPASGAAGTGITVGGTGFRSTRSITVTFNGTEVATTPATFKSDSEGSFSAVFTIPAVVNGTYKVEASDGTNEADANLAVSAGISLSTATSQAAPGHAGMELTVSGKGFIANATVTVTYATEPVVVATVTADAAGAFSATFTVPESTAGAHTITATDGTNTAVSTFVMEAAAPPVPVPLLPEMDAKAKSKACFDWEEVTDPSGVTYRLQIASDEAFSGDAIILDKGGITASEYTLTKEEKLESSKKDAPYYWRVKAVDGASNESGWTTAGTFDVGFAFELTGWFLYFLYGLWGLLLLFIGFLLGRRSAVY